MPQFENFITKLFQRFEINAEKRPANKINGPVLIRDSDGQEGDVYICPHTNCTKYSPLNKEPNPAECRHVFSVYIQKQDMVVDGNVFNKWMDYDMCDLYCD